MRQLGPVRGHEVCCLHRTKRNHVFVGTAIAHHADAFNGKEDSEGLCGEVVPAGAVGVFGVAQFFNENRIGATQKISGGSRHFTQNSHAQTGPRKRVAIHHFTRQAKRHAEFTNFVFE